MKRLWFSLPPRTVQWATLVSLTHLTAWSASDSAAPDYLRYAHPTVTQPFTDGVSLTVPRELGDARTAALGLADVTKAPFFADPTGRSDATAALQSAINFARDHQLVCFFPPGVYRVSDTLSCIQQLYRRSNGRVFGAPLWPCVLVGSAAGTNRPTILLAPHSPGFSDPAKPRRVLHFWARGYDNPTTSDRVSDGRSPEEEQPNISMNQVLRNLNIVIGEGNGGAIAVRHQAAEGSAIEDCTIDATHGLVGIEGGIGSGGGSAGVTVIGGKIGLDFTGYLSGTQPAPTITGFTLLGQTGCAIRSTSRQTLVAAGLRIVAGKTSGPLIECLPAAGQPANGQLSIIDGEIVFPHPPKHGDKPKVAIASSRSVYLNNVYVRGADRILTTPDGPGLEGNPSGWLRIPEFAHGSPSKGTADIQYRYPIYIDRERQETDLSDLKKDAEPPTDLQARHLWPSPFPSWESPAAVNVKSPPYNARGDGRADDTDAVQRALNDHDVVFLPKGYYRLTRTLELKPHNRLLGIAQHLSILFAARAEGDFANPGEPAPLVRTADSAESSTSLAFCGLWTPHDLPGLYALHWRSGPATLFRGVILLHHPAPDRAGRRPPPPRTHPAVLVTGHAGGTWYNFHEGGEYPQAPSYRHLLIEGTASPLSFYQFSPQHVASDFAAEIRAAKNVSIFGSKYEGSSPMLRVADSSKIRCFGHGGNGKPVADAALFYFERCRDFLVANAVEGPTPIGSRHLSHRLGSTDPRLWFMIIDRPASGEEVRTRPLDRPVLYRVGQP